MHTLTKRNARKADPPVDFTSPASQSQRYRSVFTTATSIDVRSPEHTSRSPSSTHRPQAQAHPRPWRPAQEPPAVPPALDEHTDDRRPSPSRTNTMTRAQTEATLQHVNNAIAQAANQLRQTPFMSNAPKTRSSTMWAEQISNRPTTSHLATRQNTGTTTSTSPYHRYQAPLPSELTVRPSTAWLAANGVLPNRVNTGTGPQMIPQSTVSGRLRTRSSTSVGTTSKTREIHGDHEILQDSAKTSKTRKAGAAEQKCKSRRQSSASRPSSVESHYRILPEVSVHPQMQSSVQQNTRQVSSSGTIHADPHHVQTESQHEMKPAPSPIKSPQTIDVRPNTTVVQQPPSSPAGDSRRPKRRKNSRNAIHTEREHTREYGLIVESADDVPMVSTPPPSPSSNDLIRVDNPSPTSHISRQAVYCRPTTRLGNYDDNSDSELTVTEPQSRDDHAAQRNEHVPTDLGSDAWSDLTSEFSITRLRKHPHILTSTPNLTRRSSSLSSKEVGQMRKQLNRLQTMYNDLFKFFENDTESIRTTIKRTAPTQPESHERKHRFRKVLATRQPSLDMKEVNQRFTRLESSIVTLAESIAKLSAQVQLQRGIKDDVVHLHEEVAELRRQIGAPPSRVLSTSEQRLASTTNAHSVNASTSTNARSNSILDPRQARKIEQFFGREAVLHHFLGLLHYEVYIPVFEKDKISFCELAFLDERKLQSMGIPHGPSVRIIYEAQQYFASLVTLKSNGVEV